MVYLINLNFKSIYYSKQMVKYIGPKIKIARRLGEVPGLVMKQVKNRKKTPGQHGILLHGKAKRSSLSDDYKNCLIEKQKLRFNYGITEKQLRSYYDLAKKSKGSTGTLLLELLEARLDCIVYRLGFASTIPYARQLVNHGHVCVNNKRVTIPSFICKNGDTISITPKYISQDIVGANIENQKQKRSLILERLSHLNLFNSRFNTQLPTHLELNSKELKGKFLCAVKRKDVLVKVNELKVVEYYSR
jgi:small subunit ribosomal protein S4